MNIYKETWSLKEEKTLNELYPESLWEELLKAIPNRTIRAIRSKAERLNIKRKKKTISKAISKGNKGKHLGDKNPSKKPEVRKKKISKGLKGRIMSKETRLKISNWSLEDEEKLKQLYSTSLWELLFKNFPNKTKSAIYQKAHKLKIKKDTFWSNEEITLLKKYYPISGIKQLYILLPSRTINAIKHKAIELNIKRKRRKQT